MSNDEEARKRANQGQTQLPTETTESQLMTPSQLQLPTLSVLVQDVPNIDQYRPKEIVRRDQNSGANPTGVGSNNPEPLDIRLSRQNDWDVPKALIETSTDLRLYDMKPRSQTETVWTLTAKLAVDHRPIVLHLGKIALNDSVRQSLSDHTQKLSKLSHLALVRPLSTGSLIGGYPYVVEESIDGPTLRECHAGIHLPGTRLHWKTGHALQILTAIRDVSFALDDMHRAEVYSAEVSIDSIQLARSDGQVKLMQVGPLMPLQAPGSVQLGERKRVADILGLGKLLHTMIFCSSLTSTNKRENPPFANWSAADFASQYSNAFPEELGNIVLKSRHAVRSQQFSSAREFGLAIDSVLVKAKRA